MTTRALRWVPTCNASQWDMWKKDGGTYATWVEQKRATVGERSHGFRYRGQYQEELAKAGTTGEGGTTR